MEEKCICHLNFGEFIKINNSCYEVKKIKGVHKTKRRYEKSLWYPKGAGYDKYKIETINVLTGEKIIDIYIAQTLFKILTLTKTNYCVIDINNDIITVLTEDYITKNIKINYTDIETYKIHTALNNEDIVEIILTILTYETISKIIDYEIISKIIDVKFIKCITI